MLHGGTGRVRLQWRAPPRRIAISKSLSVIHFRGAVAVAFDELLDPPFDVVRRAFSAAAEILIKFDLELANVALKADQIFVSLACGHGRRRDRKSTRLNSSHVAISYAVFC